MTQQKGSSLLVQLAAEGCPIGPGVRRGSRGVADPHDVIGGRPFAAGRRPRQVDLVLPGGRRTPPVRALGTSRRGSDSLGALLQLVTQVSHSSPHNGSVSPVDPVVPGHRAAAAPLAFWPLEYRAGIEGDCHLPAFCRSVSSVPAWRAAARTLRPTLSVGDPGPGPGRPQAGGAPCTLHLQVRGPGRSRGPGAGRRRGDWPWFSPPAVTLPHGVLRPVCR